MFPPRGGGGVQRTAKFAKYLPEFGWTPTVVTPDWSKETSRVQRDCDLVGDVKDAHIVHSGPPHSSNKAKTGAWAVLSRTPIMWRAVPSLRRNFQIPDDKRRWGHDAASAARSLLRTGGIDAIYSTSPPVSAHFAAMTLKSEFEIPWIADFRDPWTDNALESGQFWPIRRRLNRWLEGKIYAAADMIIANTPSNRDTLICSHGVPAEKVVTISNGYDEIDFAGVQSAPPSDFFRITYCGSAYGDYNPESVRLALERFVTRQPNAAVTWTIAGTAAKWAERIRTTPLEKRLELLGYIPHSEVPSLLTSSHLLVHAYPPGLSYSIPGKIYEYVRSGVPILAICDRPSEVERVLQYTNSGCAFSHDDIDGVVAYFADAYSRWKSGGFRCNRPLDDRTRIYERRELAAQLAKALDDILQARSPFGSGTSGVEAATDIVQK